MPSIDLNADAGESFGPWKMGSDEALFPLLSSVNLATGFHAGDPLTMQRSIALAKKHGVAVGAHPGFPDLVGFGRRDLAVTPEQAYADTLYQIGALAAFLKVEGMPLHHVKPHGALYLQMLRNEATAEAVARAVRDYDPELPLVLLPNTPMEAAARRVGVRYVREAFPDRAYLADGRLAPRSMEGALVRDPERAAERAVQMVLEGKVAALDGGEVEVRAETLCVHGDNPEAVEIARAVRRALEAAGVDVRSYR
ncbi:LamB/YcsF family protein [Oceanithermus profundus DSM 14977]|uniref:5-oxoprolinase subunit A n=1 Tax=Oceanithermus profundus (strain DSM 14977 / NBRC 100410 / VKM B-2274 / 506) TaxID=670487 RepID=E4U7W9_OCEP5|nr:5-oxoprolinase subunit PxpA [Oceanithermus profundus]ADR36568.1 LamB/YcsF family protein [Oceanithermus profundus DSM 14977]